MTSTKGTEPVHSIDFETIRNLPFTKERMALINIDAGTPDEDTLEGRVLLIERRLGILNVHTTAPSEKNQAKAADRTVRVLRTLWTIRAELQTAKAEILSSLDVSSGTVSSGTDRIAIFKIPDKTAFSGLQEIIKYRTARVASLEIAIINLDALGCGFYDDMAKATGELEGQVRDLKSKADEMRSFDPQAEAMKNVQRMSPVQIDRERTAWEAEKERLVVRLNEAMQALDVQKKKLNEIDRILNSVGIGTDPVPSTYRSVTK
jgi:hypothetical protein